MKKYFLIFIVLSIIIFNNCEYKSQSAGPIDKISVLMDSSYIDSWGNAIKDIFGTIKYYPDAEREFIIQFYDMDKYREWSVQKNLLMVGYLNGPDSVSKKLMTMLSDSLKKQIKKGKYFYFRKQDVWARDQYVMYCIGRDSYDVEVQLYGYKKQMLQEFRNYYYGMLYKQMYARAEQKELEKELFEKYDFVLRIMHDYHVAAANKRDNIYWLRRPIIDRSLFVHWLEGKGPEFIQKDSIIAERNRMGAKYFEGDYVTERDLHSFKVTFAGHKALKIEGIWQNDKYYIGGPFKTYAFYDAKLNKVFMVDLFVFIPDKRKKYYLDQLEVMANTFKLKYQISSLKDLWKDEK